jgi:hypothetical protein
MTYGRLCLCPVYRLSQTLKKPFLKPSIRTPLTVNGQTRLQFPHVLRAFAKRVFIRHHLLRHFLGSTCSHTRLETIGNRYGSGTFFSPNCLISSLRCTFLTFQFLWRGFLCLRSSLPNPRHCVSGSSFVSNLCIFSISTIVLAQ